MSHSATRITEDLVDSVFRPVTHTRSLTVRSCGHTKPRLSTYPRINMATRRKMEPSRRNVFAVYVVILLQLLASGCLSFSLASTTAGMSYLCEVSEMMTDQI